MRKPHSKPFQWALSALLRTRSGVGAGSPLQTPQGPRVGNKLSAVEIFAAGTGIVGALCMAVMADPALAFGLFLVSNLGWIAFARRREHWGLLAQQGLFLLTSLLGLWNWWLGPLLLG